MKLIIIDKGVTYTYDNVNSIKAHDGKLIINYQDENNENHEEIGNMPEYIESYDIQRL